ncbi:unnamed protein product [Allacma fusca]|uniref:Uncharacterized protein n=1 Tax=Allacma fusca TaxID=39272 RepID=A0A8J2K730_9HEXA|nr:unnamed protein product [Allacma fusca]
MGLTELLDKKMPRAVLSHGTKGHVPHMNQFYMLPKSIKICMMSHKFVVHSGEIIRTSPNVLECYNQQTRALYRRLGLTTPARASFVAHLL